jgi:hypothetical protein
LWAAARATLLVLAISGAPSFAQSQAGGGKSPDQWQFTVAPYLMMPWEDGTTAVKGQEVDVNIAPKDIFTNLQFAALGAFEARKSKWGLGVDAYYVALGTTVDHVRRNGQVFSADVDLNQGSYTFYGLRKLNDKIDFLAGARLTVLQNRVGFKGPLQTTLEATKQWVDPIVGLKMKQRIRGPLSFSLEGDIGGFGAGSKFAWQLFPVVGYDLGKRTTLAIGYRVQSFDYHAGSPDNLFKYDVILQGFVLGAAFHF